MSAQFRPAVSLELPVFPLPSRTRRGRSSRRLNFENLTEMPRKTAVWEAQRPSKLDVGPRNDARGSFTTIQEVVLGVGQEMHRRGDCHEVTDWSLASGCNFRESGRLQFCRFPETQGDHARLSILAGVRVPMSIPGQARKR